MKKLFLSGIAALSVLSASAACAVEIPKQYRGAWCQTKWKTIYKRCRSADFIEIGRTWWGVDDEGCTLSAIRKSKYGGHRLFGICQRTDPGPEDKAWGTESAATICDCKS